MITTKVAVVRYEQAGASVRTAVDLSHGLDGLRSGMKVFVKPNIVFWTRTAEIPPWGVITTSRVVEDVITLLHERGITDITVGEGTVVFNPKDRETAAHAYETLGYHALATRFGVKVFDVFDRPFEEVDLGDGVRLKFNADFLASDFVVNVPVLKTHAQTMVSLGIKNLKGLVDIPSRKKCHRADHEMDLHFMVSRLAERLPPSLTLIDGIFTNERGPSFDGKIRRSNLLIASADVLAADKVGATILGYEPSAVPHLVHACKRRGKPLDLSDVDVVGERIEDVAMHLAFSFPYNEGNTLPVPFEKMGIKGLSYPKYDLSLCTYCSVLTGTVLMAIAMAWKGKPWDGVEVLTGKLMKPSPSMKKSILIGKCLWEANRDYPDMDRVIAVKTCPPSPSAVVDALHQAGVEVSRDVIDNPEKTAGLFMKKYEGKPEYDLSLFRVAEILG